MPAWIIGRHCRAINCTRPAVVEGLCMPCWHLVRAFRREIKAAIQDEPASLKTCRDLWSIPSTTKKGGQE